MTSEPAGLILAGGLSRRMGGGDKPLIAVEGQTLLERTVTRLAPQVGTVVLNANGDPARFAALGLPVVADVLDGYGGPLVGVLSGLEWLQAQGHPAQSPAQWMVSVAADTPLFPPDLVGRMLAAAAEGADIVLAQSQGRTHPVFGLWPVRLAAELRRAVVEEDVRKIEAWTDRYKVARVSWPAQPYDPFFNVNTPEDVVRLRMILAGTLPPEPPLRAERPVAVVIERRDNPSPWVAESWRPVEVIDQPPPGPGWALLQRGEGGETYLANDLPLPLHRSDLSSYRYNLAGVEPRLFVALRRNEGGDPPVRVLLVTAAPDEAQKLAESGQDVVEGLPMPAVLRDWIELFCACHPPEEPMKKRKRDSVDTARAFNARGPQ